MAVRIADDRRAIAVTWLDEETGENPLPGGEVVITATNVETGDVGQKVPIPNTGYGSLAYPNDFTGTDDITVADEDGNVVEGQITV